MATSRLDQLRSLAPSDSFDGLTLATLLRDYESQHSPEEMAELLLSAGEQFQSTEALLYASRAIRYFRSSDDKPLLLSPGAITGAVKLMALGGFGNCGLEDRYSVLHSILCPVGDDPHGTAEAMLGLVLDGDQAVAQGIVRIGLMDQQSKGQRVRLPWE